VGSREEILGRLRAVAPPDPGRPVIPPGEPRPGDLATGFAEAVQAAGGALVAVPGEAALAAAVAALAEKLGARRIASRVPAAGPGTVRLEDLADPHELEGIDLAVIAGRFGVAENGAVWVDGEGLHHRGVFVVTQHLALVLPARELVPDLHAAYGRIRFDGPGFGLFIAGPSKTADIEQALVIGAHGARSCTIFLVG